MWQTVLLTRYISTEGAFWMKQILNICEVWRCPETFTEPHVHKCGNIHTHTPGSIPDHILSSTASQHRFTTFSAVTSSFCHMMMSFLSPHIEISYDENKNIKKKSLVEILGRPSVNGQSASEGAESLLHLTTKSISFKSRPLYATDDSLWTGLHACSQIF